MYHISLDINILLFQAKYFSRIILEILKLTNLMLSSIYALHINVNNHCRIVFDVINMLQGVWIFVLFIIFNPEAKGLFCGTATKRLETEVQMNDVEGQNLVNNRSN